MGIRISGSVNHEGARNLAGSPLEGWQTMSFHAPGTACLGPKSRRREVRIFSPNIGESWCRHGSPVQGLGLVASVLFLAALSPGCAKSTSGPADGAVGKDVVGGDVHFVGDGGEAVCGDGVLEGAEACDDGNRAEGDGCSKDCQVEEGWSCTNDQDGSTCALLPASPEVEGEISCGHPDPLWRWTRPEHTDHFEARLDGGQWARQDATELRAVDLDEGDHLFEVRACNDLGGCSAPGVFSTTIEYFGLDYPAPWRGVARRDLARSPLGNVAALSCHNCYNGPGNELYDQTQALAKIHRALGRGADLIELDLAWAGGRFCLYHGDPDDCSQAPGLEDVLDDQILAQSDALLFIELKEQDSDPDAFALALLDLLDRHREYVRNGRPLYLRKFSVTREYLDALAIHAEDYPFIEPYLRFSVLYSSGSYDDPASFQQAIQRDVLDQGYDMAEFNYQTKNLAGLIWFARKNGAGVGIWTIPGAYGEVFLAALREEVDELTVEYRIDQARSVVEETNVLAYLNPVHCQSASDQSIEVSRNTTGQVTRDSVSLGVPPTGTRYGSPPLLEDGPGQDRYSCSLDFRTAVGIQERALNLGTLSNGGTGGYLVAAVVNFDSLSLDGVQCILNNTESGGFGLQIDGDGTTTYLRYHVFVNGAYRAFTYNVAATGLSRNPSLNGSDSYLLIGGYDGNGRVLLWIDNDLGTGGASYSGAVGPTTQPGLVGADPNPGSPLGARFFFDGLVQQVTVLHWVDHEFSGPQVND